MTPHHLKVPTRLGNGAAVSKPKALLAAVGPRPASYRELTRLTLQVPYDTSHPTLLSVPFFVASWRHGLLNARKRSRRVSLKAISDRCRSSPGESPGDDSSPTTSPLQLGNGAATSPHTKG